MEKHEHLRGGAEEAIGRLETGVDGSGRRLSLRSHDVLFATALTIAAATLIGAAWMSGSSRQHPQHMQQAGPTGSITTK